MFKIINLQIETGDEMHNLNRSIILTILTFFCFLFSSVNAEDCNKNQSEDVVYLVPENIFITQEGIFYLQSENIIKVDTIHSDGKGIYIRGRENADNRCLNGHPLYHLECGGCANWWCNFRCKCSSPWGGI